jgi:aspartyl-tRNA(Asn)/glutamyl-tRNA(Gln) amidotransferase subunit C
MPRISNVDVEHSANLARIKLSEDEIAKNAQDLEEILDYADIIEQAPTGDIKPISQIVDLKNVTREDKIAPSVGAEKVLKNAPQKKDKYIRTQKIFE